MTTKPMTREEYVRYAKELLRNPLMANFNSIAFGEDFDVRVSRGDRVMSDDFLLGVFAIDIDDGDCLITRE